MWAARWFWEQRLTSSDLRPLRMPSPTTWPVITNPTSAPANAPPATYSSNTYSPNSQVLPAYMVLWKLLYVGGLQSKRKSEPYLMIFHAENGNWLPPLHACEQGCRIPHTHPLPLPRATPLLFWPFSAPLQNLHCARAQLIHQNVWRHHCTALGE